MRQRGRFEGVAAGALMLALGVLGSGAAPLRAAEPTPPPADRPWVPENLPAAVTAPAPPTADVAAAQEAVARRAASPDAATSTIVIGGHEIHGGVIDLPTGIDLALRNSPITQSTWLGALAAAAEVGSRRSEYYPDLELDDNLVKQRNVINGGALTIDQTTNTPQLLLGWLLLDFGGRAGDVGEARQLLLAANLSHNQAIQDVVLDVTDAYYRYVSARALRDAAAEDVKGSQTNLEAANQRHEAGLATVADVLQAKTALANAELQLQQDEGTMQVIRGTLATAIGMPANVPVDAAPLDENTPVEASSESIEAAIERAIAGRPELLAARARALAAEQVIRQERSAGLPTVSLAGSGNRIYYQNIDRNPANNYSAAVQLRVPLFSGFEHKYDTERAREQARQAHADAATLENDVRLQVFTSYYDLQTAATRYGTAGDLLAAADESARVAAGRYHEGVGSILDLLAAQSALSNARAQRILTRAQWLISLAQLAHDTGALQPGPTIVTSPANTTTPSVR